MYNTNAPSVSIDPVNHAPSWKVLDTPLQMTKNYLGPVKVICDMFCFLFFFFLFISSSNLISMLCKKQSENIDCVGANIHNKSISKSVSMALFEKSFTYASNTEKNLVWSIWDLLRKFVMFSFSLFSFLLLLHNIQ